MKKLKELLFILCFSFPIFVFGQQQQNSLQVQTLKELNHSCRSTDTVPTIQSSNIIFTNITTTSFTLNWSNGNGAHRVMFVREGDTGIAKPVDGTFYWAQTVFKSGTQLGSTGWYCVLNGGGGPLTVTGLDVLSNSMAARNTPWKWASPKLKLF